MAQSVAEKKICDSCGAEVREGSTFCYNCGESTVVEPLPPAILKPEAGPFNRRTGKVLEDTGQLNREPPPVAPPTVPLAIPEARPQMEESATPAPATRIDAKTRAEQRTKAAEWVETEISPLKFAVVAIALTIIGIVLVIAALYLR